VRGRAIAVAVAVAASLVTATLATPASGSSAQFAGVRQATAAFHNLAKAKAAGYEEFLPCIDAPGVGGMGQHFVDMAALDGIVEAAHPEALVYEPRGNKYRLVGVEYVVPQAAWQGTDPPELFGEHFHRNDALGIWALHAWIWRHNPDGMHADFNPKVSLC
jgi:hypothetical protein